VSALSRFKVLDLTLARSGPACVRQLADWGASVIRIEPPGGGQDFADRHHPDFQNLHRNKRCLSLNLKSEQGLQLFKELVRRADVLVENFRPDVKHRLGFDYDSMRLVNPRLIYTSISGFGQDGPYRDRPGVDQIAQGMGGLMSVTGEPGRGPLRAGIAVSDMAAGLLAALGTLTALLERESSGEGQWVRTSLLEAQIFMLDFQAARWLMGGQKAVQEGNHHPTASPMGCFKAKDGYINLAPMPAMWPEFCAILGMDEIAHQPDFATNEKRCQNRGRITKMIEGALAQRDCVSWIEIFNKAGIPCGPVYSIEQVFEDEQVRHLGVAQTVDSSTLGRIRLNGQPITMSRSKSPLLSAAAEAGGNTHEILAELGYSDVEIENFRKGDIV
jgi:formyl-CoA transferase